LGWKAGREGLLNGRGRTISAGKKGGQRGEEKRRDVRVIASDKTKNQARGDHHRAEERKGGDLFPGTRGRKSEGGGRRDAAANGELSGGEGKRKKEWNPAFVSQNEAGGAGAKKPAS